jgi:hypothetical protein
LVTGTRLAPIDRADRELDNSKRSPRRGQPPGTKGPLYFDNAPVAADEQHVDGELHEERVDARTRRKDKAVTLGEGRPA